MSTVSRIKTIIILVIKAQHYSEGRKMRENFLNTHTCSCQAWQFPGEANIDY